MNKDLNLNINLDSIKASLLRLPALLNKYVIPIFAVFVLVIYGFLVWQINNFSHVAPSEDKIATEQETIKRPKIDEETIQKIEQLEDQNIAVQSLFKAARDNPFKDN